MVECGRAAGTAWRVRTGRAQGGDCSTSIGMQGLRLAVSLWIRLPGDKLGCTLHASVTSMYAPCALLMMQVMAFSATYTPTLLADLEPLLKRPQRVMMCEETVSLLGIQQYYRLVGSSVPPPVEQEQQQGQQEQQEQEQQGLSEQVLGVSDGNGDLSGAVGSEDVRQGQQGQQEGAGSSGATHEDVLPAKVDALLELLSTMSFHQVRDCA